MAAVPNQTSTDRIASVMERAMITVRVFEERKAAAEWLGVPLKILYPPGEQKRKPIA